MSSGGHTRKRGANSWQIKYDAPTENGGRRTVFVTVRGGKRDAQAELARRLAQVADGIHADPNRIELGGFITERIQLWLNAGTISPRTAEQYFALHRRRIEPHLGGMLLQKLRTQHVEQWHATLRADGLGNRSVRIVHQIVARALKDAVKHGLVVRNVAAEQRPPKVDSEPVAILSKEQIVQLPARSRARIARSLHRPAAFRVAGVAMVRHQLRPGRAQREPGVGGDERTRLAD